MIYPLLRQDWVQTCDMLGTRLDLKICEDSSHVEIDICLNRLRKISPPVRDFCDDSRIASREYDASGGNNHDGIAPETSEGFVTEIPGPIWIKEAIFA